MKEDEECEYDHTLIEDSSAQSNGKENCSVGKDNSNMCLQGCCHRDIIDAIAS